MQEFTHNQARYQVQFITAAGYPVDRFAGVEHTWWYNTLNHNSLRLTRTGLEWAERHAKVQFIEVEISHRIFGKQLLQLERLLQEPYFIGDKYLHLASSQDAVMLQLHAGNLGQYLDNLQNQ